MFLSDSNSQQPVVVSLESYKEKKNEQRKQQLSQSVNLYLQMSAVGWNEVSVSLNLPTVFPNSWKLHANELYTRFKLPEECSDSYLYDCLDPDYSFNWQEAYCGVAST